ncbi:MAG: GNAT family N-acetyltransferase [Alphaproteobacteria bacterium]|nr:GNAT family N-acetyltransferase [Alphaproteobacteria bacterium]MDP6830641.1 GNAT family N-acetyltransferase [Alphaproteobacteria bacterium]
MQAGDKIRRARAEDAAAVSACVRAAYKMYLPRMAEPPGPMLQDYTRVIAEHLVWVMEIGDEIGGVLVLIRRDDHLLLDNIAVHPNRHGRGLGGRLLALADSEAARLGYDELRLYTHVTMTENVALYQAKGWIVTGQGMQDGYERIFMSRRLDP